MNGFKSFLVISAFILSAPAMAHTGHGVEASGLQHWLEHAFYAVAILAGPLTLFWLLRRGDDRKKSNAK